MGDIVRKALVVDLTEGIHRGRLLGAFFSMRGAVLFPAAFVGGWLWEWSPTAPFVVGGAISSVGVVWFLVFTLKP